MRDIGDFEWQKRLIIVFVQEADLQATEETLDREKALIDDRHIIWFVISGETVSSNYSESMHPELATRLREQFQLDPSSPTEVILVGKDGGIKHRSNSLDTLDLYYRIDQMPMRQSEMRSGK